MVPRCWSKAFSVLAFTAVLPSQGPPALLLDLNTGPAVTNAQVLVLGPLGRAYFTGVSHSHGRELWTTDGTAQGTFLLKDIYPGASSGFSSADAKMMFSPGLGRLLFAATSPDSPGLWVSDGTTSGTVPIHPVTVGEFLGVMPTTGVVLFRGFRAEGNELWRTDGTAGGTSLVADIYPGPSSSDPHDGVVWGNRVYFGANDLVHGDELWASDATAAGTALVRDIEPGSLGSSPKDLRVLSYTPGSLPFSRIYFSAYQSLTGRELWRSDGSTAGTVQVADLRPGPAWSSPIPCESRLYGNPRVSYNVFVAYTDATGEELWVESFNQVSLLADINPGLGGSQPVWLGNGFFSADQPGIGRELWYTGHTAGTTQLVKDIDIGASGSGPTGWVLDGSVGYFWASDGYGRELWRTDGSLAGTSMIKDIKEGGSGFADSYALLRRVAGQILFAATDGRDPTLWRTDGSETGTVRVGTQGTQASVPMGFVELEGITYFSAEADSTGRELWRSDRTPTGTHIVKDVYYGPADGNPAGLTVVGNRLYFAATSGAPMGYEFRSVIVSDGTSNGTRPVFGSPREPSFLTAYNGELYFAGDWTDYGRELSRTNGSVATLVRDLVPGSTGSDPQDLVVAGDRLFLTASDGAIRRLCMSDGTGLWIVSVDARSPSYLKPLGNRVCFLADGRPWLSDGTPAGTAAIPTAPLICSWLAVVGDRIFVSSGGELWHGTPNGPFSILDVNPGPAGSYPADPTAFGTGTSLLFAAFRASYGREIFRFDDDPPRVTLVRDVRVGAGDGYVGGLVVPPGATRAVFVADDGVSGMELWRTDGTEANTVRHHDVRSGPGSSWPKSIGHAGNTIFFAADDGMTGHELWAMDSMAASIPYGRGCPGINREVPELWGYNGSPSIGNQQYAVQVKRARVGAGVLAVIAFRSTTIPTGGGCAFLVDPGSVFVGFGAFTNTSGSAEFPLPIPANPSLSGARVFAQAFVFDPSAAGGYAYSNGLDVSLYDN